MKKNTMLLASASGFLPRVGVMTKNERRLGRYIRDGEGHPATPQSVEQLDSILKEFQDTAGFSDDDVNEFKQMVAARREEFAPA